MKKTPHRWVLWDLSNGPDSGTKRRFTFYAWVFRTRAAARKLFQIHRHNRGYTDVTYPEKLSRNRVAALYQPVPDCINPHYYHRRRTDIPM
jgi:hypothetical protein